MCLKINVFYYNPIFADIEKATEEFSRTQNYLPSPEEIENIKSAESTLRVLLDDLGLVRFNDEFSYFEIETAEAGKLRGSRRLVGERVYGQGDDFVKNMEMLSAAGIKTTRVYVLNPEYVEKQVKGKEAIARAGWLYDFSSISDFFAGDSILNYTNLHLRGVPLVAAGDAAQDIGVQEAYYEIILADSKRAVEALDDKSASGLLGIVSTYLSTKGQ